MRKLRQWERPALSRGTQDKFDKQGMFQAAIPHEERPFGIDRRLLHVEA